IKFFVSNNIYNLELLVKFTLLYKNELPFELIMEYLSSIHFDDVYNFNIMKLLLYHGDEITYNFTIDNINNIHLINNPKIKFHVEKDVMINILYNIYNVNITNETIITTKNMINDIIPFSEDMPAKIYKLQLDKVFILFVINLMPQQFIKLLY